MNFQQLNTFCAILNEGSMTAAAQKLFLTQPAVSQQIRALEEDIGVDLFVRGSRHMKPTLQGQILYDYAQKIIKIADQARVTIQTVGVEVRGRIRIGTINSIGLHLIGSVFHIFMKNNSDVRVQLHYKQGFEIIRQLEEGNLDIAVIPDAEKEYGKSIQNQNKEFISRDEICLVVSGMNNKAPLEIQLKDLTQMPLIFLIDQYKGFENIFLKELKRKGISCSPVFESSNVGTLKRVIESGMGWGFLPRHSIKKQLREGRLKHVRIVDFEYFVDLCTYWPRQGVTSKAIDVFIKTLKNSSNLKIS